MTNLARLRADQQIGQTTRVMHEAFERLSTGKRINRASDDPAGMIAASDLTLTIESIREKIEALEFEDKRLGAIDGAQSVIADLVLELQGIVVSASSEGGTSEVEREAMQIEAVSIVRAIDHLANTTVFNGELILRGSASSSLGGMTWTTQHADGSTSTGTYSLADLANGRLSLVDGDHELMQKIVDAAAGQAGAARAGVGLRLKEIARSIDQHLTEFENLSAARSLIEDTDYAAETSRLVRAQVLQQAGIYTAKIADGIKAESALKLLSSVPVRGR